MACQAIRYWTFSRLIGAFFDLGVATFLLCCSTAAFFISTFLGFFGFSLLCTCNGLFSKPNSDHCLLRLLVASPRNKISHIQLYVRSTLSFDSVWNRNEGLQLSFNVVRGKKLDFGVIELEGEASCSSVSPATKEGRHRQRVDLRRRSRSSIDHIKLTPNSSYDNSRSDVPVVPLSKCGNGNTGKEIASESSTAIYSHDFVENIRELDHKSWPSFESNGVMDANKVVDKDMIPLRGQRNDNGQHLLNDGNLENAIRILEQAVGEERAARAALLFDLEKERIAAATAAGEAMAVISRLQEEKAAINLEARQYVRLLEEKSSYDAEEMDVLREIIVRREKEKHYLEKEVESYRKMLQGNEQWEGDVDNVTDI